MSLRLAAVSLAVLALAACNQAAAPAGPEPVPVPPAATPAPGAVILTPKGLGPILIGMTDADIRAAAGASNIAPKVGADASEGCSQVRLQGAYPGVILMLEDGKLTRIDLDDQSAFKTDKGIAVGATPAEVMAAYPDAKAEPHKYSDAPAQYLTVWTVPDKEGTVFEVGNEGKVSIIHAGGPSIQYVEGCA